MSNSNVLCAPFQVVTKNSNLQSRLHSLMLAAQFALDCQTLSRCRCKRHLLYIMNFYQRLQVSLSIFSACLFELIFNRRIRAGVSRDWKMKIGRIILTCFESFVDNIQGRHWTLILYLLEVSVLLSGTLGNFGIWKVNVCRNGHFVSNVL